eukprot:750814-Hanusia_phi.AAC.1
MALRVCPTAILPPRTLRQQRAPRSLGAPRAYRTLSNIIIVVLSYNPLCHKTLPAPAPPGCTAGHRVTPPHHPPMTPSLKGRVRGGNAAVRRFQVTVTAPRK